MSEWYHLGQYESTLGQLTNAEILIDELKAQLDAAAAADELLLQLTDRNDILDEVRKSCILVVTWPGVLISGGG